MMRKNNRSRSEIHDTHDTYDTLFITYIRYNVYTKIYFMCNIHMIYIKFRKQVS